MATTALGAGVIVDNVMVGVAVGRPIADSKEGRTPTIKSRISPAPTSEPQTRQ
jgi:hypothetical protein